jgi:Mce-associated membrane protein
MTLEHGSSLDGSEAATDGVGIPDVDEDGQPSTGEGSTRFRWLAVIARRWRSIVATTLVVAAMLVAGGVFFTVHRPDQRVGDATAHRAIQAASDGAVAVLTYSYDHLYRDFATAKSHLTGGFLTYYSKFTEDVIGPMAQKGQLTTTAKVIRAAISELHPDSAVVLVFVDQNTVSTTKKDPVKTESAVVVTLTKINGSWLIAKFNPVG